VKYRLSWFGTTVARLLLLGLVAARPTPVPAAPPAPGAPPAVRHLPLIELRAAADSDDIFAIILSGDGGWADLDRDFGKAFQRRGLSTVGFDCLKYFWKARQADEVANDLQAAIRFYLHAWRKQQVLLVGYSFGADWLPFLVNRLPADLQQRVRLVVLLAPGASVNVEIKVGDWFRDVERPGAISVAPEAARIRLPTLCVYGVDEAHTSICPGLQGANVRLLRMPGGHHFGNRYTAIETAILQSIAREAPRQYEHR
jgi:type IV secretory pathway VirJ component